MHVEPNIHDMEKPFADLYEELVSEMTLIHELHKHRIEEIVSEFCRRFRLCRAVTYLYKNPQEEHSHKGEVQSCYDLGIEGKPLLHHRVVTSVMSISDMTVYQAEDAEPLSDAEMKRLDLLMRTVLSYLSRNRLRNIVEDLAFHDNMGYPNFRSFHHYMQTHDIRGRFAMQYNLRHFVLVNQEIGRKAADIVMYNHFRRMVELIGDTGTVCRLGGDNFTAICSVENFNAVLDYLTETTVPYDDEGNSIILRTSVGVYRLPKDFVFTDPGVVMECITAPFRVAQTGGNDRIVFYSEQLLRAKEHAMKIQRMMPQALKNREFRVFYQPKVDTVTGKLTGAEALCRWFRDGKIVPPMEFIPILEQTTDICKLDFYMLDLVCNDLRRWLDEGRSPVRISVNLSRKHMMDADLVNTIIRIIDRCEIPHEYIEIELTETTTDVEFRDLKRVVGGLQQAGIFTSVDDFGMGYSSLNLIRDVPWNVLKIDKSFVPLEEDTPDSTRSILFGHVVEMARQIGLECIAEGVETKRQVDILRYFHCDVAQGFYFDRPLPVEEFEKRMEQRFYSMDDTLSKG